AIAQDSTTLIIRDGHYGFDPCRGERCNWQNMRVDYIISNESAILFRPELRGLAANMSQSMNAGDYDAVRVRRGDKLNTDMWPHVANDTSPPALLEKLPRFVAPGRTLYIATNEKTPGFFDPLKAVFAIRQFRDFDHLWAPGTPWFDGYARILGPDPKLDPYME
ncbi:unnamed protein product, partial [Closterium sp. Naga37s-1]